MKEKELIIIGASGFALEVFWLAKRAGYEIKGFLDDSPDCHGKLIFGKSVIGKVEDWINFSDFAFVIAVGSPRVRKVIFDKMNNSRTKPEYATLIDPAAILGENVNFGEGSIVCAGVIATVEISAGRHVIVNLNCTIGHETTIGDFTTIAPLAAVSGRVNIGSFVEIGTSASIRQGLKIESGAMLGMGAVLTKDIEEPALYFGSPAKFVKKLSTQEE